MRKLIPLTILLVSIFIETSAESFDNTAMLILQQGRAYKSDSLSLESKTNQLRTENNLPDPELEGEYLVGPSGEADRWGATLSWGVEWPGIYNARKKEIALREQAASSEITVDRINRLNEIKRLLLDYILTEQKMKVLRNLVAINDSITRYVDQSVKSGQITVLDQNKVKLENALVKGQMGALLDEQGAIVTALDNIYGGSCREILSQMSVEFPPLDLPSSEQLERISKNAAEVEQANANLNVAMANRNTVRMQSLPSLSIGFKHAYEEGEHFNGAVVGVSLPLFSSRHKSVAVKSAIKEAEYEIELKEAEISAQTEGSLKRLVILEKQIDEMEPVLLSSDNEAMLMEAYRGGVITLVDYFRERNYFTAATMELLMLKHSAANVLLDILQYENPFVR